MTIREKLAIMEEIDRTNRERVRLFLEQLKKEAEEEQEKEMM